MAHDIDHLVVSTPKGVKINLGSLYVYEDGHANLTFRDDKNIDWPMNDGLEIVSILVNDLIRPMHKRAKREQRAKRIAAAKSKP